MENNDNATMFNKREAATIAQGMVTAATIIAKALSGLTDAVFALVHTVDAGKTPEPPPTA